MQFIQQYGLIILLAVLLIFMFWSSRRRQQRQKAEQAAKAKQTLPGAEVMLQGGLYGTIVEYDPENLDQPAIVEIAPGVDIKVHSQAILRVVTATEEPGAHEAIDDEPLADEPRLETSEETAERLKRENDSDQK
jgi:preprotein translocase subunit YajC